MIFKISNKTLSDTLQNIARVLSSKNVLPILDNFIFDVKGTTLTLTAADPENMMTTTVCLDEAEGEGSFAVNAKDMMAAMKNLDDTQVQFNTEDERLVKVCYNSGMFSLPTFPTDDFPKVPEIGEEGIEFQIPENLLQENLARTVFATADDELRPVMNTICFNLMTEGLDIVASDGHQLVRNRLENIKAEEQQEGTFLLPVKPAMILKNILGKNEENVTVRSDSRRMEISTERFILNCRLVEGRYPKYDAVIPKNNENILTVNRTGLISLLKRLAPFSNSASKMMKLQMEPGVPGTLRVEAEDYDFSKTATETIICEYDGQPMTIGMKGTSVIEILENIKSEEVEFRLADPSRAALIFPSEQPEGQNILMLQMPMLING